MWWPTFFNKFYGWKYVPFAHAGPVGQPPQTTNCRRWESTHLRLHLTCFKRIVGHLQPVPSLSAAVGGVSAKQAGFRHGYCEAVTLATRMDCCNCWRSFRWLPWNALSSSGTRWKWPREIGYGRFSNADSSKSVVFDVWKMVSLDLSWWSDHMHVSGPASCAGQSMLIVVGKKPTTPWDAPNSWSLDGSGVWRKKWCLNGVMVVFHPYEQL